MKPLNLDKSGCINTSSNCVVWQGPDIACISLCKGDSVTDVVYKMATELCVVMDTFNLDNYDLSCFGSGPCNPADFKALMQLILTKICYIQECSGCQDSCYPCGTTPPVVMSAGARSASLQAYSLPGDTVVPIAPVFYYTNQYGDLVTTMPLTDYVIAIGNKVNQLVTSITAIQATLINHAARITALEDAPAPVFVIPQITPVCVLPSVATNMNIVLAAVEQQFCQLRTATGTPNNIFTNIQKQIPNLNSAPVLSGAGGTMASLPGWTSTIQNEADSLGNLWITIGDMRSALQNILNNLIPSGCAGISLTLFASYDTGSNSVTIFINGTIPASFVNTDSFGTRFTITDIYGSATTANVDIISIVNNLTGFNIPLNGTLLNGLTNLRIEGNPNFTDVNTGSQCQSCLEYSILNQGSCPIVTYTTTSDAINYSFLSDSNTQTYTVELWNDLGNVLLSSQSYISSSVTTYTGSFEATLGVTYKLRVTINIASVITTCAFTVVTV